MEIFDHENTETGTDILRRIAAALFAALCIIYEEILLNLSTVRTMDSIHVPQVFLFSAAYGILIVWAGSLFRNRKAKQFVCGSLYSVICVIYTVYYFVFRNFKVFYDVNTVFSGASGAATGFSDQILSMVFSPDGLVHIFLSLMPVMLYILLRSRLDTDAPVSADNRVQLYISAAVFILTGIRCVQGNARLARVYAEEYSFQTAVTDFGLMTGIRLDVEHHLRNRTGAAEFLNEPAVEEPAEEAAENPETKLTVYGLSRMNIDFDALMTEGDPICRQLDEYVRVQKPSRKNEYTGLFRGKNLIFITAEAFSAEVIDPDLTPTLYRLAEKGFNFTDYYQPASAGTTGGEYENIFGLLPFEGGASFKITSRFHNHLTMSWQLNQLGYNGWAYHNNDYTFYDRHITHSNLGYSNGYTGWGNGLEEKMTDQWPQSDREMIEATVDDYIDAQPFNVYYMTVSAHNPYAIGNPMVRNHWDQVADLDNYTDEVKGYLAANLELEDAAAYLVKRLEEKGIADDTVIVIAADHFPYGLDYGNSLSEADNLANLYGYRPSGYLERDHNRLIMWSGCLEEQEPVIIDSPTSSLDILPTLLNLFGIEWDSRLLPGRDVFSDRMPLVFTLNYDWKTDQGTYNASTGIFTPAEGSDAGNEYADQIRQIVQNKISYCRSVLKTDYYLHVFGNSK